MTQQLQQSICGMKLNEWNAKDVFGLVGGLLACWDPTTVEGHLLNQSRYSVTTKFTCKNSGFMWILMNVCGPHEQAKRRKFFIELTQLRQLVLDNTSASRTMGLDGGF